MSDDIKQVLLTAFGVVFAKAVDIAWEEFKERKEKKEAPRDAGKQGKER